MKTLVLCIDALFSRDLKVLQDDPRLATLFTHAVTVEDIEAVYPTLTYPTHVSIVSGVSPAIHRVIANQPLNPATENCDWFWHYDQIHTRTIFEAMHENRLITASVFWPVTASGPIDYLVPEIWSNKGDSLPVVKENSSHNIDDILEAHREMLDFEDKLKQDTYGCRCAVDIVRRYNPDVLFVHFCLIDKTRHLYGINHEYVKRDLDVIGGFYAQIMEAVYSVQQKEPTVIVLGDHGHLNYKSNLLPNVEFEKRGWVSRDNPDTYKVYCHGCGISAQVYLRNTDLYSEVEKLFENWKQQGYLYDYYTRIQTAEIGLDGDFAYVLEAADGYSIISNFGNDFVSLLSLPKGVEGFGNHGHLPSRGNKPPFMVSNPDIPGYSVVKGGKMLDLAPTICLIHGLKFWPMQGNAIEEIVRYF